MAEIIRNRVIRPSTRLAKSKSYKIDTTKVLDGDVLIVNITHESLAFKREYKIDGSALAFKKSISFKVLEIDEIPCIIWYGEINNFIEKI